MLAQPAERRALREQRSAQSDKHLFLRDANGFRRLLLLLTSSGDQNDVFSKQEPPGSSLTRPLHIAG